MSYTVNKLSMITGLDRRTVAKRMDGHPHESLLRGAKLYSAEVALAALVVAVEESEQRDAAKDTKNKLAVIELQNAEVQQLAGLDKLCLLEDARLYLAEERIAVRQAIERSDDLSETQKKRILTKLQAIKSKPPEPFKS